SGNILKYDLNGGLIWNSAVTGINNMQTQSIDTDAAGNIYVAGNFGGTLTVNGMPVTGEGGAVFMKYNAAGNLLWYKTGTRDPASSVSSGAAFPAEITINSLGTPISTGYYEGSLMFS